jgi:hypothetical protein
MKYAKALILCIILWLLTVIYPVVSVWFGEMAIQRAGVM